MTVYPFCACPPPTRSSGPAPLRAQSWSWARAGGDRVHRNPYLVQRETGEGPVQQPFCAWALAGMEFDRFPESIDGRRNRENEFTIGGERGESIMAIIDDRDTEIRFPDFSSHLWTPFATLQLKTSLENMTHRNPLDEKALTSVYLWLKKC